MDDPLIKERLRKDKRHRAIVRGMLIVITSLLMFIALGIYA